MTTKSRNMWTKKSSFHCGEEENKKRKSCSCKLNVAYVGVCLGENLDYKMFVKSFFVIRYCSGAGELPCQRENHCFSTTATLNYFDDVKEMNNWKKLNVDTSIERRFNNFTSKLTVSLHVKMNFA